MEMAQRPLVAQATTSSQTANTSVIDLSTGEGGQTGPTAMPLAAAVLLVASALFTDDGRQRKKPPLSPAAPP
ncbi:unnamed protein product [Cuscuta campestris]|uniref:Uncharacterized protein n=1 Tax=Cuscuta campestris TaxID=132261 RepID=A0A484KVV0_9ASTE|nr:unnamed protein product [Cuscuta campestris]